MEKQLFKIGGALYTKKYLAENCIGKQILVLENIENQHLIHIPLEELPAPYVPNYVNIKAGQYYVLDSGVFYNHSDRNFDIGSGHILLDTEGNPVQEGKAYRYYERVVIPSILTLKSLRRNDSDLEEGEYNPNVTVSALSGNPLVDPVYIPAYGYEFLCDKGDKEIFQSTISGKWFWNRDVELFEEGDIVVSKQDIESGLTENYFVCPNCGDIHQVECSVEVYGGDIVCEECIDDEYTYSDLMNTYIHNDDVFYFEDDGDFCNDPIHESLRSQYGWRSDVTGDWWSDNATPLTTSDGYTYHESEEWRLHFCDVDEEWYYDEDNAPEGLIRGYHKRPELKFFGEGPKYFGLELECDDPCADGDDGDVRYIFDGHMDRFYFNSDGSLVNGFEAITHPMSPKEMLSMDWEKIASRNAIEKLLQR